MGKLSLSIYINLGYYVDDITNWSLNLNSLDNLTDCGEQRMYRLGVSLRNHYRGHLNYDAYSILALSSSSTRCLKSQQATLRGLFEITSSMKFGRELLSRRDKIVEGLGSNDISSQIAQFTDLVPLEWGCYKRSMYHRENPGPLVEDLCLDKDIAQMPGIDRLKEILKTRYEQKFNTDIFDIWTAIECELYLDRTKETIDYTDHFADWINEPVAENSNAGLYDLFEVVTQIGFIRRVDSKAQYLLISPLIKSLIESQSVAIDSMTLMNSNELTGRYYGKQMILYSTHDFILTTMLNNLGIHQIGDTSKFLERFAEANQSDFNDLKRYLSGLMMAHFGLSLKFELHMVSLSTGCNLPIVRLAIYNQDSPTALDIQWEPVALGEIIRKRYRELYPDGENPDKFYATELGFMIDMKYDCPFELFNEVAKDWIMNDTKYESIYNNIFTDDCDI